MDSLHHVKTSVSVRSGTIWGISIREWCYFSLVGTFEKSIKNLKVKVDARKEALRLKKRKLTIDVLVPSNSHFHALLSYGDSPQ